MSTGAHDSEAGWVPTDLLPGDPAGPDLSLGLPVWRLPRMN